MPIIKSVDTRKVTTSDDERLENHRAPDKAALPGGVPWKSARPATHGFRFIQQFLSPRLIREFKLFALSDAAEDQHYTVQAIHDERGYRDVRRCLAEMYDLSRIEPDIQVADVDLLGDRELQLRHTMRDDIPLAAEDRERVLAHLKDALGLRRPSRQHRGRGGHAPR